MIFSDLKAALADLGVTLRDGDDPPDLADELADQRTYRASLYLDFLRQTQTFMTATLNQPVGQGGVGPPKDYQFVQEAVTSPALLNKLALQLDHWVVPAVQAVLATLPQLASYADYQNYFNTQILDQNNNVYGRH